MRRWSIPVIDIFGIHFRVHFSFPLMFCLVWILEAGHGPQVGIAQLHADAAGDVRGAGA